MFFNYEFGYLEGSENIFRLKVSIILNRSLIFTHQTEPKYYEKSGKQALDYDICGNGGYANYYSLRP